MIGREGKIVYVASVPRSGERSVAHSGGLNCVYIVVVAFSSIEFI
jgi:hypothetical protein